MFTVHSQAESEVAFLLGPGLPGFSPDLLGPHIGGRKTYIDGEATTY